MSEALYAVVFTDEQHRKLMELIEQGVLTPTTSFHTVVNEMEFGPLQNTQLPGDTSVVQLGDTHIRVFHPVYDKNFLMSSANYLNTKFRSQIVAVLFEWSAEDVCFYLYSLFPDGTKGNSIRRTIEQTFKAVKDLLDDPKQLEANN